MQEAKLVACDKPLACFRSALLLFGAAPSLFDVAVGAIA